MAEPNIRLTFRNGGWVLAMAGAAVVGITTWAILPALLRLTDHAPGDNTTIESYEFDLSNLQIDRTTIVPSMQHRNMSPVLNTPEILSPEQVIERNSVFLNPYLVTNDLVVGITVNGKSRAYPLHVLHVHEIINDTLGDLPISITWHWLSGHVAVYGRAFSGHEMEFANSGLAGNGGMLIYDKQEVVGGEQLFSTILGTSISGTPMQLKSIAHDVVSWQTWNEMHPESSVIAPIKELKKRYRKGDPKIYFLTDTIYFPSSPMPTDGTDPKTVVVVIPTKTGNVVFSIPQLLERADDNGVVHLNVGGSKISISVNQSPLYAIVRDDGGSVVQSQRSLWFAWYGNHPNDTITSP
jgi:hypothetical protein